MSLVDFRSKIFNNKITGIITEIMEAGGRVYLVGGAVRDILQEREPADLDFMVMGPAQKWFEKLFPAARSVGRNYSIYQLEGYDFDFIDQSSRDIKSELARRDFTINAIALDLQNEEIIDPFKGRRDLENGIIRALPGAVKADPLRAYRAARFAAEFDTFKITEETRLMMQEGGGELSGISVERVFEEMRKALESENPPVFFKELRSSSILTYHFPELDDLIGVGQPEEFHPEGDVFNHTMLSLEAAAARTTDPMIRFCVLVHDLGKALTPEEEWPHHYRHDREGLKPLRKLCSRLRVPMRWKKAAELAITEHMKGYRWQRMRSGKIVQLLERAERSPLGLRGLGIVIESDRRGRSDLLLDVPEASQLTELGERLFRETGGSSISGVEEGPEFGEKLFQYRSCWVKSALEKNN